MPLRGALGLPRCGPCRYQVRLTQRHGLAEPQGKVRPCLCLHGPDLKYVCGLDWKSPGGRNRLSGSAPASPGQTPAPSVFPARTSLTVQTGQWPSSEESTGSMCVRGCVQGCAPHCLCTHRPHPVPAWLSMAVHVPGLAAGSWPPVCSCGMTTVPVSELSAEHCG